MGLDLRRLVVLQVLSRHRDQRVLLLIKVEHLLQAIVFMFILLLYLIPQGWHQIPV